jgi:hypothetical protein
MTNDFDAAFNAFPTRYFVVDVHGIVQLSSDFVNQGDTGLPALEAFLERFAGGNGGDGMDQGHDMLYQGGSFDDGDEYDAADDFFSW